MIFAGLPAITTFPCGNDFVTTDPSLFGGKQVVSIEGHIGTVDPISIEFTYAPFITLNFAAETTHHSALASTLRHNGMTDLVVSAVLTDGTNSTAVSAFRTFNASYTYDLSVTTSTENMTVTAEFGVYTGYQFNGIRVPMKTDGSSGETIITASSGTITFPKIAVSVK